MSDERRIDDREHDLEHGHLDPVADEHLAAVQTRYEESIGWHRD